MSVIISLILIAISIIIILAIIIKKLPALAILDVNNIAGVKEAKFKDQIIKKRLERDLNKVGGLFSRIWLRINKRTSNFFKSLYTNLKQKQQNYKANKPMSLEEKKEKVKRLFSTVEDLLKKESLDKAEEKLIEIVSLDQTNVLAFFKLGNLYQNLKKSLESRQSYQYALKLIKQYKDDKDVIGETSISHVYFSLSLLEKEEDNLDLALEYIIEALDIEPNNPRYLDLIIDLSIMKKDKEKAATYFNKLSEVNPDNNKLEELEKKIEEL